jgi:hypothetical protein
MSRLRFSIANLLALVLFFAVAIAALRESNDPWESGLFSAAIMLLLLSVLLAVHRSDRERAFWLGFSLFGVMYLALSLAPPVEPRLLTTKGLAYLQSKLRGPDLAKTLTLYVNGPGNQVTVERLAFSPSGQNVTIAAAGSVSVIPDQTSQNFLRIGHSLAALVLAFAGGHISRILYARRRRDESPKSTTPP